MKNIVVIGSNGMLGQAFVKNISNYFNQFSIRELNSDKIDISDIGKTSQQLSILKPDYVINCAAYHNSSLCELNPSTAFNINSVGCLNLSKLSNEYDFKFIHFSTNFVYDGVLNYSPKNIYSISKLAGDFIIKNYCKNYLIIRTANIYGKIPSKQKGNNLILTLIEKIKNQEVIKCYPNRITPTNVECLANSTLNILKSDRYNETINIVNRGNCTVEELVKFISNKLNIEAYIEKVEEDVNNSKFHSGPCLWSSEKMQRWDEALNNFLDQYIKENK